MGYTLFKGKILTTCSDNIFFSDITAVSMETCNFVKAPLSAILLYNRQDVCPLLSKLCRWIMCTLSSSKNTAPLTLLLNGASIGMCQQPIWSHLILRITRSSVHRWTQLKPPLKLWGCWTWKKISKKLAMSLVLCHASVIVVKCSCRLMNEERGYCK